MARGRPRKEIDKKQFENLCGLQCTESEICGFFGVSDRTLERWCKSNYGMNFVDIFAEKRMAGKISLRRNQFNLSRTNATMAIFLGKQYLGQKDQPDADQAALEKLDELLKEFKDATKR